MSLRTLRLKEKWEDGNLSNSSFRRQKTLYPNMIETIKSTKVLVKEGFKVMVYCTDDPRCKN